MMDNHQQRRSSDSNHYHPEGPAKTRKFSKWMKRLVQPNHGDHARQYIRPHPAPSTDTANKHNDHPVKPSATIAFPNTNDADYIEDNASDNFSIQGMLSIKTANLGKKQGLSLDKHPDFDEDQEKHIFTKSEFADKDITFEKLDAESKVSANTISTKSHAIYNIHESKEPKAEETASKFSDKNSILSDGAVSITGQETINSSLIGIPPQSILENGRSNHMTSNQRVPVTTPSMASQSIKNYKLFPKTHANHNSEQYSSDNHTIVSLFSGVGTTTSHFNYFYDRNNDLRSETNSESNSMINDMFSV